MSRNSSSLDSSHRVRNLDIARLPDPRLPDELNAVDFPIGGNRFRTEELTDAVSPAAQVERGVKRWETWTRNQVPLVHTLPERTLPERLPS